MFIILFIENNKLLEDNIIELKNNINDFNSNIMTLRNNNTKKEKEILKLKLRIDTMKISSKISSKYV